MYEWRSGLRLTVLMLMGGCQPAVELTSFDQEVMPLFNRHCAVCHMGDGAQGEFSFYPLPYQSMVGVKSVQSPLALIEAGSAEASYVYHKMMGTQQAVNGSGAGMPYQRELLGETELAMVRQWIDEGANEN